MNHRVSERNQLEQMLSEIRKAIGRQESHVANIERDFMAIAGPKHVKAVRSLDRLKSIEAYLQADYRALATGSPLAAAMGTDAPATEHHGPEQL